jgi:hypothetical protein
MGLRTGTPASAKSATFLVTTTSPATAAVAAMNRSGCENVAHGLAALNHAPPLQDHLLIEVQDTLAEPGPQLPFQPSFQLLAKGLARVSFDSDANFGNRDPAEIEELLSLSLRRVALASGNRRIQRYAPGAGRHRDRRHEYRGGHHLGGNRGRATAGKHPAWPVSPSRLPRRRLGRAGR